MESVDALVLGAGPAGLGAAASLVGNSGVRVRVIEYGRSIEMRDRNDQVDVSSGIGGAGLFSDGKFSFFPSATKLWDLVPQDDLSSAWRWYRNLLRDFSWADLVPDLPNHAATRTPEAIRRHLLAKTYPSYYSTLAERTALTSSLVQSFGTDAISLCTDIDEIELTSRGVHVLARDRTSGREAEFRSRALIVATGRLSPLELVRFIPDAPWRQGRLEVGIRLEQPAHEFFLATHPSTDPKLIATGVDGSTTRTFCCCRDGEVVTTYTRGIVSVSGRADVSPTGRSNIGIIARPSAAAQRNDPSLLDRVTDVGRRFVCDASSFLAVSPDVELVEVLGQSITRQIGVAIDEIANLTGGTTSIGRSLVHGPAIEGVGRYPQLHDDLRWGGAPVWVAGDATGLFRGLTAAFVSGYFAGKRAREYLAAG